MKKAFKKYFVVTLSLFLILSNFSFATQLMFCEMTGDTKVCECKKDDVKKFDGVSLTKHKSNCCNEETTELSNSNNLVIANNDLNNDLFPHVNIYFNNSVELIHIYSNSIQYTPDKSHLPEIDIPVFTSSLLI